METEGRKTISVLMVIVLVLAVESRTVNRYLPRLGMNNLLANFRTKGVEQPTGANHQGKAMKTLHPMETQTQITGYIKPQRNLLLAPPQWIGVHQVPQYPPPV